SVTGTQITFDTLAGDDLLTIDYSGGSYKQAINYLAGTQTTSDALQLQGGGPFANVTHTFLNNNDGTVAITGNGLVSYTGLEPITDKLVATARVFTYSGGPETINISDVGGGA